MSRHRPAAVVMTLLVLLQGTGIVAAPGDCPDSGPVRGACCSCCCGAERPAEGVALTATGCCRTELVPVPLAETEFVSESANPAPAPIPPLATGLSRLRPPAPPTTPPPGWRETSRIHAPPCFSLYCTLLN